MNNSSSNEITLKDVLLLWPFAFVPLTLFLVKQFGNIAGDFLLGALFLYLLWQKADLPTRRLMVCLAVLGAIFETANVAAGLYKYSGVIGAPMWISLGWGILGWWIVQLEPKLARVRFSHAFAFATLVVLSNVVLGNGLSPSIPIALAGLYVLSLASTKPFSVFAFTAFFAVVAEYSGTATGVWQYFSNTGSGVAVLPDLAALAMAYSTVMMFCMWLSGFEKTN